MHTNSKLGYKYHVVCS